MTSGTRRRLLIWGPVFGLFVIVWWLLYLPDVQAYLILRGAPPLRQAETVEPATLPDDLVLTCVDGSILTPGDLHGRPTVLSVFATWCPPCMAEVPGLQRLHSQLGDDARVLLVALDKPDALAAWCTANNADQALFATANAFGPPLASTAIPLTLVINGHGKVINRVQGAYAWDDASVAPWVRGLEAL